MSAASTSQSADVTLRTFPVAVEMLASGTLEMDLYVKPTRDAQPTLYRAVGDQFTADDRQQLTDQNISFVYVPFAQHAAYRRGLLNQLEQEFFDPDKDRQERVETVRRACSKMIEQALLFPGQPGSIEAVADISRRFTEWSARHNDEFSYLMDMSAHDYYTVTHMVNVGFGCGLLARELFPGDDDFQATVIQGGMLHDLGKREIPIEILNKEGGLEPHEWKILSRHPLVGYEILKANRAIPTTVLEMVRDHHERPDGKGYPHKCSGDSLGIPARICSVVDVFDAISAARSYRGPTPPPMTLRLMSEGAGTQFDADILEHWARLVTGLIERDPERAVSNVPVDPNLTLTAFMPGNPNRTVVTTPRGATNIWDSERRRHKRHDCSIVIRAVFIRQGKQCPVPIGSAVAVRMTDVSQGGLQLETKWPLTIDDILEVELPLPGGRKAMHRARVVRVRGKRNVWLAGLCFISDE